MISGSTTVAKIREKKLTSNIHVRNIVTVVEMSEETICYTSREIERVTSVGVAAVKSKKRISAFGGR